MTQSPEPKSPDESVFNELTTSELESNLQVPFHRRVWNSIRYVFQPKVYAGTVVDTGPLTTGPLPPNQRKHFDIQDIDLDRLLISNRYYKHVLFQARASFISASIAALAGFGFFLYAVYILISQQAQSAATISLVSGALVEVISGVNFYLYGRTSIQLATFHERLEGARQYLTIFQYADRVCDKLEGDLKHTTRAELVGKIAGLPITLSDKEQWTSKRTKNGIKTKGGKKGKKQGTAQEQSQPVK